MIYLKNKTLLQDVYIPRQDMLPYTTGSSGTYAEGYSDGYEDGTQDQKDKLASTAFTENGLYTREDGWNEVEVSVEAPLPVLEDKTVVISADTTTVTPSSGYDGISAVTVDASDYAQENYDGGFEDGFEDGYSSGSTDEKAKLSGVTFTANTQVSLDDGGYSAVTVNVPQTGHTDQELEDAYESGYTSGQTDQKNLLTTTAFTENGSYHRENGWSGVTVNIDTASTYNSGYTDGYDSGYTSGETHQKSLLVSTAFTENGEYQSENGYSAITVNVPTGQTYNVEENHPFTATSNGNYTITPSSGQTNKIIGYEDGVDFYFTASTYPSVGYFDIGAIDFENSQGSIIGSVYIYYENGHIDYDDSDWAGRIYTRTTGNTMLYVGFDEDDYSDYVWIEGEDISFNYDVMSAVSLNVNVDTASTYQSGYTDGHTSGVTEGENNIISTFSSTTATTNGQYGSTAHPLSSITVNVPQTGSTAVLGVGSFSANGTYSASTDNLDGYSAITINVQTGTKEIVMCVSGGCWFNTNYLMEYGDQIEFEHCTFGKYGAASASRHQQYVGGGSGEFFRIGTSDNELYLKYFYYSVPVYNHLPSDHSLIEDETVLFNSTGFTIGGNVITAYTAGSESRKANIIFFANTESGADSVQNQTAKMGRVKVYSYDGTLKATFEPRLDEFNVPYFKYIEEDIDIYASGNTAPFYEEIIINEDYQSGYTDGQNSIISTFTATTATTNGVYGSSANPLSSITVNVPQTGSTGTTSIFFADYIHTEVLEDNEKYGRIDTGIYQTVDTVFRVKGMAKGYAAGNELVGFDLNDSGEYSDYRLFAYSTSGENLGYDWYSERLETSNWGGLYDGREIDFTCSNYQVYDNINETVLLSGNAQTNVNQSIPIYANTTNWWLKSLEIWQGNTKVFDGVAAYDENGNIGLYDSVSRELKYNSGVVMEYEIISPSDYYDSGYTDGYYSGYTSGYTSGTTDGFNSGYTSGYTDGSNDEKALLSAITFTANTAITVNSGGYSAITVNVDAIKIIPVSSIHHSDIGDGKNYFLDTGIYPTTATTVRVKGVGAGYYPNNGFVYAEVNKSSVSDSDWMLSIQKDIDPAYNLLGFSIKSRTRTIAEWGEPSVGRQIDVTCSDFEMTDNISQSSVTASTLSFTSSGTLKVNVGCWWLKGIQIWEASELVFDGIAAYDENGHIGLYDNISGALVYDPDYTMVYENPVLGNVTLTANGIYNASNFGTEGFSAVTVNVDDNYGELIGLYCTNNCQFVLSYKQYLENTSIEFGIRTGGASINITSGATAPSVNRIDVDSNGNVTGHSYSSAGGAGAYATGSGQTSVVLNAFPTKNYMLIDTDTKNTTKVNGSSASTCINYSSTPANNLLLSIDDGYFYEGAINNTGADYQSCIFPHVDSDGNACILGDYGLFYPISGNCYPIYKNGNNYYVLMKSQPWNQQ